MKKSMFLLLVVVMIASLALGACATPTTAPTVAVTEAPVVTEAPLSPKPRCHRAPCHRSSRCNRSCSNQNRNITSFDW